jgi:hypothetical protein
MLISSAANRPASLIFKGFAQHAWRCAASRSATLCNKGFVTKVTRQLAFKVKSA